MTRVTAECYISVCFLCLIDSHAVRISSRGQKWNPLRLRLDSYDYTVEQHIVGSLLFTPLLLLLPTTSVFYIFFTIMSSSISVLCILTEAIISFIHATPYVKIFLWLVSPKRFPAGIWLQIISYKLNRIQTTEWNSFPQDGRLRSKDICGNYEAEKSVDGTQTLVSSLHSSFPSIGKGWIFLIIFLSVAAGVSDIRNVWDYCFWTGGKWWLFLSFA